MSVDQTQNGNFLIVWDTEYRNHEPEIDDNLSVQLIYYVKGREESIETVSEMFNQHPCFGRRIWYYHTVILIPELTIFPLYQVNLTNIQKPYELIGRKLESTSEYIVKARVKYHLSPHFSDYSDSFPFKTRKYYLLNTSKYVLKQTFITVLNCVHSHVSPGHSEDTDSHHMSDSDLHHYYCLHILHQVRLLPF